MVAAFSIKLEQEQLKPAYDKFFTEELLASVYINDAVRPKHFVIHRQTAAPTVVPH